MSSNEYRKRPPPEEVFFAPLLRDKSPQELEAIGFAWDCTEKGHEGLFRDDGSPQADHPKAAAWIYIDELGGRDTRIIIVILLHDHREEETKLLSEYRIKLNFGDEIADNVDGLTKRPGETRIDFLNRVIAAGVIAIMAKLSDRLHNMRTLDACATEKQAEQTKETLEIDMPMLIPALRKFGGENEHFATIYEVLINEAIAPYRAKFEKIIQT